jgi:hypothetical protein
MEEEKVKKRIEAILPVLNERQSRIYLACEAQSTGWSGGQYPRRQTHHRRGIVETWHAASLR